MGNVKELGEDPELGKRIVLVVEDDVLQRMWVSQFLRDANFVVVEAANLAEARSALKGAPGIDIVFADVVLPDGGNIVDLVMWMAAERPDLPIVLTSGQSRPNEALNLSACANVTDYLPKPFACEQVERILRQRTSPRA